jgi:hypothetical protein
VATHPSRLSSLYPTKLGTSAVPPDSRYFTVRLQRAAAGDTPTYWSEQVHELTATKLPGITDLIWKERAL